jgi:hypothetical protein
MPCHLASLRNKVWHPSCWGGRQQFTKEEILAGLDELRQKGGVELPEFVEELESALLSNHERTQPGYP